MNHSIKITKGLDLKLAGGADASMKPVKVVPSSVAIVPDDYVGIMPKVEVKEGDSVKAGDPLFHDKRGDGRLKVVSPVDGIVSAIVRGERRKLERVVVTPSATQDDTKPSSFKTPATASEIRELLLSSGMWAMMRQRPYDIVPEPDAKPRDFFVTAIDSAPLALSPTAFFGQEGRALGMAVEALGKLTDGHVYIARRPNSMPSIQGAEMIDVDGPHPSGNVGVHIANVAPVNKGEVVITLDLATLWRIGKLLCDGVAPFVTYVAVTGSDVVAPKAVETFIGADIASIVKGNLRDSDKHQRIISGNVLTGVKVSEDGYLRYPYRQVTVIPEGDDVDEFMGWASLSPKHMSTSRSFPGHFLFKKLFKPDARLHGGRRALIMSGEYDRYMPMDIMAEYLLKAIIGRDIERMEQLGIYEVAPEDFALGEYADTSKLEAQKIVREGLDYLRKEVE